MSVHGQDSSTETPLDDTAAGDVADELTLSMVAGVGPRIRSLLLDRFGMPSAILDAPPSQLQQVPGVGSKLSRAICRAREDIDVEAELALCRELGIDLVLQRDDLYPRLLREVCDPPGLLYVRGALLAEDAMAVAMVGSRHATRYGTEVADRLAGGLARAGMTIVSGLARGIDVAAHRGALKAGGRTIAVTGGGLAEIYPPEHADVAQSISKSGALLSESPLRSAPRRGSFPQRNRLISGISLGVIVVEAGERSGALITARHAMEQGREVFAVPGRIDSRMSRGCHRLIRDGAALVEGVDDVLDALGPLVAPAIDRGGRIVHHPAELSLNDQERRVLDAISETSTLIDDIVVASGLTTPQVLATLSALEIRRLVRREAGQLYARL